MKSILPVAILICFIGTSCKSVQFAKAQPDGVASLKEFPSDLIGTYVEGDHDTLVISHSGFKYGSKTSSVFYLERELAKNKAELKEFNGSYVLSLKHNGYWEVLLLKPTNTELQVFYISLAGKEEEVINKLNSVLPVKTVKDKEGNVAYYLINPSKENFETLVAQGFFVTQGSFVRLKKQ